MKIQITIGTATREWQLTEAQLAEIKRIGNEISDRGSELIEGMLVSGECDVEKECMDKIEARYLEAMTEGGISSVVDLLSGRVIDDLVNGGISNE